jgi:hypothetical protein
MRIVSAIDSRLPSASPTRVPRQFLIRLAGRFEPTPPTFPDQFSRALRRNAGLRRHPLFQPPESPEYGLHVRCAKVCTGNPAWGTVEPDDRRLQPARIDSAHPSDEVLVGNTKLTRYRGALQILRPRQLQAFKRLQLQLYFSERNLKRS